MSTKMDNTADIESVGPCLTCSGRRTLEARLIGALFGGGLLGVSWLYAQLVPDQGDIASVIALFASLCVSVPVIVIALRGFLKVQPTYVPEQVVALACLAAIASGRYEVATLVPLFMLLGHILEEHSIQGAQAAIGGLTKLTAKTATVLSEEGEQQVSVEELKVGDTIIVKAGDSLPADGMVREGVSSVDESLITGESVPRDVNKGCQVYAGSSNVSGRLIVEVTEVGGETALGRIVGLLHAAQRSKPPIVKITERYAIHYLPLVLMIAAGVLLLTGEMNRAITVLIVSCPCAFVLSSPSAMIAALAVASRFGILIKNAKFLEKMVEVDTLIFDKTGTVSLGELDVLQIKSLNGLGENRILELAANAAGASQHPLSRAICREAASRGMGRDLSLEVKEIPGQGLIMSTGGDITRVGKREWLESCGDKVSTNIKHSGPVVWVATGGEAVGAILLADKPRPEVKEAIAQMKSLGVSHFTMLTGDRREVAESMARELGVGKVYSELLPEEKLDAVRKEKEDNRTVMVVGDGINDALALAAADVGVAMGAMGCDVAIKSADLALMHNDLRHLATAIRLSRETRRTINLNIFVGAGFSVLMLALAASGIIQPLAGALLHNVGAVFVVFNSARILKFTSRGGCEYADQSAYTCSSRCKTGECEHC